MQDSKNRDEAIADRARGTLKVVQRPQTVYPRCNVESLNFRRGVIG